MNGSPPDTVMSCHHRVPCFGSLKRSGSGGSFAGKAARWIRWRPRVRAICSTLRRRGRASTSPGIDRVRAWWHSRCSADTTGADGERTRGAGAAPHGSVGRRSPVERERRVHIQTTAPSSARRHSPRQRTVAHRPERIGIVFAAARDGRRNYVDPTRSRNSPNFARPRWVTIQDRRYGITTTDSVRATRHAAGALHRPPARIF